MSKPIKVGVVAVVIFVKKKFSSKSVESIEILGKKKDMSQKVLIQKIKVKKVSSKKFSVQKNLGKRIKVNKFLGIYL